MAPGPRSLGLHRTAQEFTEAGPLFEALSSGDLDLFLDGWLPITHQSYMETYGDKLEPIGTWNENAALTVAVPTYVDVESLADLNANADLFGGSIVGIEASAGLTEAVQNSAIPTYGITDLSSRPPRPRRCSPSSTARSRPRSRSW